MQQLLTAVGASRWVAVRSVAADRRNLHLRLELFPPSRVRHPDVWLVSCLRVREFSLSDFDGGGLNWWRHDHPLLAQYTSPKASLHVRVSPADQELALGVLFRPHPVISSPAIF